MDALSTRYEGGWTQGMVDPGVNGVVDPIYAGINRVCQRWNLYARTRTGTPRREDDRF